MAYRSHPAGAGNLSQEASRRSEGSRDGRPSGGETELQNGKRIGTAGVERLEVGEPGVGLGLVDVREAAEVLADECRHVAAEGLGVHRLGGERMGGAAGVRGAGAPGGGGGGLREGGGGGGGGPGPPSPAPPVRGGGKAPPA